MSIGPYTLKYSSVAFYCSQQSFGGEKGLYSSWKSK